IPLRLKNPNGQVRDPFWIDASLIDAKGHYTGEGEIRQTVAWSIEHLIATPPNASGCVAVGDSWIDYVNPPSHRDLDTAVGEADFIVKGIVRKRSYGLFSNDVGQMLSVTVTKELKGISPLKTYYFFIPVGSFRLGPVDICKTDSKYPVIPEPGDTVILLGHEGFRAGPFLNIIDEGGLLPLTQDGHVAVPRRYRAALGAAVLPEDEVVDLIAR